jgi:plasmid stabilization system protein ParE
VTTHPIDTEALRKTTDAASGGPWGVLGQYVFADEGRDGIAQFSTDADAEFIAAARTAIPALLDALAAAEHRATRAEAQSSIRGRAVVIRRQRAREAEARIAAVQALIDQADHAGDWTVTSTRLQWAIDGTDQEG